MAVDSTQLDYDNNVAAWLRARDVFAGEDAVKAAGVRYLPRLDAQTDPEYVAYKTRASFFNATARTADGFVGLILRRDATVKLPDPGSGVGKALANFADDADMLGTSLPAYAKNVVTEVITVGRAGTLVDWEIPSNVMPKALVEATCEQARELLIVDRSATPEGEGLKYFNDGSVQKGYDKADKRPIISTVAQAMLAKYGTLIRAKSGAVRLTRA